MEPRALLVVSAVATLALYVIPGGRVVARPLVLLSSLVHELGHGLTAMGVGGSFQRLAVFADGSGMATYSGRFSPASLAAIAAGGPLAPPALAAALFLALAYPSRAPIVLLAFAGLVGIAAIIWVRNLFGILFALTVGVALGAIALLAPAQAPLACAFLGVQLSLAAFARADYLFKSTARTATGMVASDTAQIAQAFGLAPWFWGALLAVVSLAVLGAGLWMAGVA